MESIIGFLKVASVIVAAALVGNWFLSEVRKGRRAGAPWYAPYLSIPGILIIAMILLPILMQVMRR